MRYGSSGVAKTQKGEAKTQVVIKFCESDAGFVDAMP